MYKKKPQRQKTIIIVIQGSCLIPVKSLTAKTYPLEPNRSHYINVLQGAIFMEQNMRFWLILGWLAILKKMSRL